MATLLWQRRDLASDASSVRNTFSSWDSCMSQAYCKWPVIAAIILGSLIALSVIWCGLRCLCCGAECCCGCLSCCNRCCPSPRGRGKNTEGYQPPPQTQYQPYGQGPGMYYGAGGYAPAQTATFAAPTRGGKYNDDSLPAMPSWSNAQSRRVEDDDDMDDVEMEKLDQQQQSLLYPQSDTSARYYNNAPQHTGDLGDARTAPHHNYSQHQQQVSSPVSSTAASSIYPPTYQTRADASVYDSYAASVAPSYHTAAPGAYGVSRKPVADSWRNV